jgi:hypothetical protein
MIEVNWQLEVVRQVYIAYSLCAAVPFGVLLADSAASKKQLKHTSNKCLRLNASASSDNMHETVSQDTIINYAKRGTSSEPCLVAQQQ